MKNLLESVLKWLSTTPSLGERAQRLPEHERRLRELQKSGRVSLLP
jgi:hypothetical protein